MSNRSPQFRTTMLSVKYYTFFFLHKRSTISTYKDRHNFKIYKYTVECLKSNASYPQYPHATMNSKILSINLDLSSFEKFQYFKVIETSPSIVNVQINRPNKGNCFNRDTWRQYRDIFIQLNKIPAVKLIILTGLGKNFCTGLDLKFFNGYIKNLKSEKQVSQNEVEKEIYFLIREFQDCISTPMRIDIPMMVICHGACIGLALDIIACSFIRYCVEDCVFKIPEIKMGFAADIGALQRLPRIVSNVSLLNELVLTGDPFNADIAIAKLSIFSKKFKNIESASKYVSHISKKISNFTKDGIVGVKFQVTETLENETETEKMMDKIAVFNASFFSKM